MNHSSSPLLKEIRAKVEAGERLSMEDGLVLYRPETPLGEIAELANLVRERRNGNFAYYNINTHLNPTNVCILRATCTFCSFARTPKEDGAYTMSLAHLLHSRRWQELDAAIPQRNERRVLRLFRVFRSHARYRDE